MITIYMMWLHKIHETYVTVNNICEIIIKSIYIYIYRFMYENYMKKKKNSYNFNIIKLCYYPIIVSINNFSFFFPLFFDKYLLVHEFSLFLCILFFFSSSLIIYIYILKTSFRQIFTTCNVCY